MLPGSEFIETTGSRLANEGVAGAKKHIEQSSMRVVVHFFWMRLINLLMATTPEGHLYSTFYWQRSRIELARLSLFLPAIPRRWRSSSSIIQDSTAACHTVSHFADYSDKELLAMLRRRIEKKYHGRAELEDGMAGLYARIAIRRLGRGRGREGYGNARALENMWAKISERQASRLQRERAAGAKPDDFIFTKEDLIGPEPSGAVQDSAAWKDLQGSDRAQGC